MDGGEFEVAHVLFMDVVGYSQMLIDDQRDMLRELKAIVRNTSQFRTAEEQQKLVCLPTGDGMVIAFFTAPDAAVRCAMEIARVLRSHPAIQLRQREQPLRAWKLPRSQARRLAAQQSNAKWEHAPAPLPALFLL